jgi:hypothetical protein
LDHLRALFLDYPGDSLVYFKIKNGQQENILKTGFRVAYQPELVARIKSDFAGALNVVEN